MNRASLPAERALLLAGLSSLALIAGALGFQYLGGIAPCEMCHWQRWPHIATALLGLTIVPLWKKAILLPAMVVVALAAICGLVVAYRWNMLNLWQPIILAVTILGLLAFALWKKDLRLLAMVAIALVAISGLIGAYQTGTQFGWLPGPAACTAVRYVMGSNVVPEVSCTSVTWSLFGLSLAAYNAIISFLVAGTAAIALARRP